MEPLAEAPRPPHPRRLAPVSRIALVALALATCGALGLVLHLLGADPGGGGARPLAAAPAVARAAATTELPAAAARAPAESPDLTGWAGPGQPLSGAGQAPTQLNGRVIDRSGSAAQGAVVQLLVAGSDAWSVEAAATSISCAVDGEGRFRVDGAPTARPLLLEARHPERAPTRVPVRALEPGEARDVGDILLAPGTTLVGTVSSEAGGLLPGARVELLEGVSAGPLVAHATSGPDGRYELPNLGARQYTVVASAAGHARLESVQAFLLGPVGPSWTVDFVLPLADQALEGRARDAGGRPVGPLDLRLRLRRTQHAGSLQFEGRSDTEGRFRFEPVPAGRYELELESGDWYLPREVLLDTALGPDQEVVVEPALTLAARVVASGALPTTLALTIQPEGRSGARVLAGRPVRRTPSLDAEGRFALPGLRPGVYTLLVEAEGFAPVTSAEWRIEPGPASAVDELVIALAAGGSLRGVVDPVLEGVRVELREGEWDPASPLEDSFPTAPLGGRGAPVDAEGGFLIEHLAPGRYVVTARAPGHPATHLRDVQVEEGRTRDVGKLELTAGGRVEGRVTGLDGRPRAGAKVRLRSPDVHLATTTDADGSFRLEAVPAGRYEVSAVPASLAEALTQEARAEVLVRADEGAFLELPLSERLAPAR